MNRRARAVAALVVSVNLMLGSTPANADDHPPTFTKGKFAVPISRDDVKKDWTARGYSSPKVESYPQGWSRDEHTHPVSLIMALITGRMEFTFGAQRFVLEPGDELSYAANTKHAARNIDDRTTQMLESFKRP